MDFSLYRKGRVTPQSSPSKHASVPATRFTRSASLTPNSLKGVVLGSTKGGLKREKAVKDKRRSTRKSEATPPASSQWYMPAVVQDSPVFELTQELTAKRPLRSEVERERRLSRPSSGQYSNRFSLSTPRLNGNGTSSNRDSIGTTDSTASEEDGVPPPLPIKSREADYCNLPDVDSGVEVTSRPHTMHLLRLNTKPVPPEPIEDDRPPTPPPKRPHMKLPTS